MGIRKNLPCKSAEAIVRIKPLNGERQGTCLYANLMSSAMAGAGGNSTAVLLSDDLEIYSLPQFADYTPGQLVPSSSGLLSGG